MCRILKRNISSFKRNIVRYRKGMQMVIECKTNNPCFHKFWFAPPSHIHFSFANSSQRGHIYHDHRIQEIGKKHYLRNTVQCIGEIQVTQFKGETKVQLRDKTPP